MHKFVKAWSHIYTGSKQSMQYSDIIFIMKRNPIKTYAAAAPAAIDDCTQ